MIGLRSAASSGQTTPSTILTMRLGRLLKRAKGTGSTAETRVYYWLGLNKIAEEVWGAEATGTSTVSRPDNEASTSPSTNGWAVAGGQGGSIMSYTWDTDRGQVPPPHAFQLE